MQTRLPRLQSDLRESIRTMYRILDSEKEAETFDPPEADKCLLASGELDVHKDRTSYPEFQISIFFA